MFDPVRICQILNEEGVAYVIVGGFASVVHGSSLPTCRTWSRCETTSEIADELVEASDGLATDLQRG